MPRGPTVNRHERDRAEFDVAVPRQIAPGVDQRAFLGAYFRRQKMARNRMALGGQIGDDVLAKFSPAVLPIDPRRYFPSAVSSSSLRSEAT